MVALWVATAVLATLYTALWIDVRALREEVMQDRERDRERVRTIDHGGE